MWKKVRITAAGSGMRTVAKEEGARPPRRDAGRLRRGGLTVVSLLMVCMHSLTGEGHEVVMDEPQKMGGTDTGATPLHTLLASLAGCEHGTHAD
jgi:hypothetical protein